MTQLLRTVSLLALVAAHTACTSGQKVPVAPAAPSAVVATGDVPEPAVDLSPVAAPRDLIVVGRWQAPEQTVDTLAKWSKFPLDWRSALDELARSSGEGAVRETFALKAPVDLVVTLPPGGPGGPQPQAVVSIGLSSLEGAVAFAEQKGEVEALSNRVYRVRDVGDAACFLAPSVGVAPARLVCGDSARSVEALLPYVTRTLPQESLGTADVHLELRVEPLRRNFGGLIEGAGQLVIPLVLNEVGLDDSRFDRALADTIRGGLREVAAVLQDLDRVVLDADLVEGTGMAEAKLTLDMRSRTSWSAQVLGDAKDRSVGAPELFWNLPAEVSTASFGQGANPERLAPIKRTLADLADGLLAHGQVPKGVRDQVVTIIERSFTSKAVQVGAQGALPPRPPAKAGTPSAEEDPIASMTAQLGWRLFGLENEPAKGYIEYLDAWVKLYNDPTVQKLLQEKLDVDPKRLPKLRARAATGKGFAPGSRQYELVFQLEGEGTKKREETIFLVVVPEGKHTWIGMSTDLKRLGAEIERVRKPAGKTLRDRPGLEPLRHDRYVAAGFTTTRGLLEAVASGPLFRGAAVESTLNALPHHGETPIITSIRVLDGAGPRLEWTLSGPKEVVEDLAAAVPAMVAASVLGGAF